MGQYLNGEETMPDLHTKDRPVYNKIEIDKSTYPVSRIAERLAKMRNWAVCISALDEKTKTFVYDVAVTAEKIERKYVTYDEACKNLHWKKFDVVNNNQALKWYRDPDWDKYVEDAMVRSAEAPIWESKDDGKTWKKFKVKEVKTEK